MLIREFALTSILVGAGLTLGLSGASAQVVTCAQEGQICRVPAAATVYFGVPGRTTTITAAGPVACNTQTFGRDPAPNVPKGCSYVLDGGRGAGGGARARGGPERDLDRPRDRGRDGDFDRPRGRDRDADLDRPRGRDRDGDFDRPRGRDRDVDERRSRRDFDEDRDDRPRGSSRF